LQRRAKLAAVISVFANKLNGQESNVIGADMKETAKRRVWQIPKAGNIKRLALVEDTVEPLSPEQIRVETAAIGLNFADIFALAGMYSAAPQSAFIPGLEFSGEIAALGDEVSKFSVGDKVMGVCRLGYSKTIVPHIGHSCENRNPGLFLHIWMPASAGMMNMMKRLRAV